MPAVRPLAPADSYVAGRLDVSTAADLRAVLLSALDRLAARAADSAPDSDELAGAPEFVVDLSGVDGVDMVGVGLLVAVHRHAGRVGRRLVLTGAPPRVMRLLTATRLRRVLVVRDLPRPAAARPAAQEVALPLSLGGDAAVAI